MPKNRSQFPLPVTNNSQSQVKTSTTCDEAELCRQVSKAAELGTFWFNLETKESYYSPHYRALLGLAPDAPLPSPPEHYAQWIFPVDRERVAAAWRRFVQEPQDRPFEEEYRALRPDGTVIWVMEKCSLTWRETGGQPVPVSGLGLLISINATKNVNSRLRIKRERLEAALAASGTGTFRWNITTQKIICDESLERLLSVPPGERLTNIREAVKLVHPADRSMVIEAFTRAANEGAPVNVQFRVPRPDAGSAWLMAKGQPILNKSGQPIYMIGACMDITERKTATELFRKEAAARELEHRRLLTVLDVLPVGVFITNVKGKIVSTNKACRQIWGPPKLPDDPLDYAEAFKGWHLDTGQPILPQEWGLAKVLLQGSQEFAEEIEIEATDGSRKTILYHAVPFHDNRGNIMGAVAVNIDLSQRRAMEDKLRHLAELVESSQDSIIGLSMEGRITSWNEGAERLYGYSQEEVLGKHIRILEPSPNQDEMEKLLEQIHKGQQIEPQETIRIRKDGRKIWVSFTISPLYDTRGQLSGASVIARDITERKRADEERALLAVIVETSTDAIVSTDLDWHVTSWNKAAEQLFGYRAEEALGSDIIARQLVPPEREEELQALREKLMRGERPPPFDTVRRTKDGKTVDVSLSCAPILDKHKRISGIAYISRDITERKRMEEQLHHDAFHDRLTGLPNRTLFIDRLKHVIDRAHRFDEYYAVFVLDIDNFKLINDTMGHLVGDQLLQGFSKRVLEVLRPVDTLARFGGDEFTLILEEVGNQDIVIHIAERIQDTLKTPFILDKQEIRIGSSVGITMGDRHYNHPDEVLRDADLALYEAKRRGKSQYVVFDARMRHEKAVRQHLNNELRAAIEDNNLSIDYQPIVNLLTSRVVGCEALARWHHSVMGQIATKEFIDIAEASGFVDRLDHLVIEKAVGSLAKWLQHPAIPEDFYLSVNISSKLFYSQNLPAFLTNLLNTYGLKGKNLRLEVSEDLLLKRYQIAEAILERLQSMDIRVCLDNFSMEHASLRYLRTLPINVVKIDCSYGQELSQNQQNREVMRSILHLASILNVEPIAEYAETEEQLDQIRDLGFQRAQGFALHQPMKHREITKLIAGVH